MAGNKATGSGHTPACASRVRGRFQPLADTAAPHGHRATAAAYAAGFGPRAGSAPKNPAAAAPRPVADPALPTPGPHGVPRAHKRPGWPAVPGEGGSSQDRSAKNPSTSAHRAPDSDAATPKPSQASPGHRSSQVARPADANRP